MSVKRIAVEDKVGNKYDLVEVDGVTFPAYFTDDPAQRMSEVKDMPGRDSDVVIVAYPKAGTHWVWEMADMLLRGSAEYHQSAKEDLMLELMGPKVLAEVESPRVLNSHLRFRQLPKDMIARNCKLIHVSRNPKDMAVSRYCHARNSTAQAYKGPFSDYLPLYLDGLVAFGSWFDYTCDWEKAIKDNQDYPIHVMVYEDIKRDPLAAVKGLSDFLGCSTSPDLLQAICDSCSFSKMKDGYQKKGFSGTQVNPKEYSFRKGQIGDWKTWFTVADNERFDAVMAEKLKGCNQTYTYE